MILTGCPVSGRYRSQTGHIVFRHEGVRARGRPRRWGRFAQSAISTPSTASQQAATSTGSSIMIAPVGETFR
ncbi:hypothetical protein SANTM175S_01381 [Streptomyces antimycoticus]